MLGIRMHGLAYILTQQAPTLLATNANDLGIARVLPGFPVAGLLVEAPVKRWVPKRPRASRAHLVVVK